MDVATGLVTLYLPSATGMPSVKRSIIVVLICGFAVVALNGCDQQNNRAMEDVNALQGTWVTLKIVMDGKVELDLSEPPSEGPVSTLAYGGHKWVVKLGANELASGTSKLDSTTTPKHIDLNHESGPLQGKTLLGIYKLDGDEYTACIAAPGKDRPTEFASIEGSGQRLVICRRERR